MCRQQVPANHLVFSCPQLWAPSKQQAAMQGELCSNIGCYVGYWVLCWARRQLVLLLQVALSREHSRDSWLNDQAQLAADDLFIKVS
jgi:hypothetical protein